MTIKRSSGCPGFESRVAPNRADTAPQTGQTAPIRPPGELGTYTIFGVPPRVLSRYEPNSPPSASTWPSPLRPQHTARTGSYAYSNTSRPAKRRTRAPGQATRVVVNSQTVTGSDAFAFTCTDGESGASPPRGIALGPLRARVEAHRSTGGGERRTHALDDHQGFELGVAHEPAVIEGRGAGLVFGHLPAVDPNDAGQS